MADIWMDVDTALSEVPVNKVPLIDDTDFKTIEDAVAYNAAGMDLNWNFVTTAGAFTQTNVVPTTAGVHDWTSQANGMYTLEIPASAGTINNDTEGFGWFTGVCTGVLPWSGPVIGFRAAALNNAMIDGGDNLDVNVVQWLGTAAATPATAGVPSVDVVYVSGDSGAADNLEADYDGTGYNKSNSTIGTTTTNTDMRGTDSAFTAASALSYGLDHLISAALPTSWATDVVSGSVFYNLAGATFDTSTDSNEAIRNHIGDGTNLTEAGGNGDHLTEAGGTGDQLTAIPWNASWDAEVQSEANDALVALGLDHLVSTSVTGTDVADNSIIASIVSKSATPDWDSYVNTTDALEAIADAGGSSLTQILTVNPLIPSAIDLANTATYRVGLQLVNSLDDLPSTAEITPGTIDIDRKAKGGTSWTSVVSAAACSESAGLVYYDEVFDSGTGYAEGDMLRITFKSVSITADTNTYEVCDATGNMYYTGILTATPGVDVTSWNGTALSTTNPLPNAAAGAAGGLPTDSAGKTSFNDPTAATIADSVWDEDIVAAHSTADTAGAILSNILPEKNAAFSDIEFLFVAASDHVTPVTGATGTAVTRSIDGGAFGSGTGTLAEVGNGIYQYDASAADMNGTVITFRFTGTGGTPGAPDDVFLTVKTSG